MNVEVSLKTVEIYKARPREARPVHRAAIVRYGALRGWLNDIVEQG